MTLHLDPGLAVPTHPGGKREFQVVRSKCVVLNGRVDRFVKETLVAKEVLGYAEPNTKELSQLGGAVIGRHNTNRRRADHMIIWYNSQLPPRIDDGKQAQVSIGCPLIWSF